MRRSFKAFINPNNTNLNQLSRYIKDSLKENISKWGISPTGLVLSHSKTFPQKVRITLTIERIK